jgi:pyruvate formate lyase activating enzyme
MDTMAAAATPQMLAEACRELDCRSIAFTYNDPVIFHEYAIDVAEACHEVGVKSVAVTAGYICPEPRQEFFAVMDAANIDLKAFTESFYYELCGAHLAEVLETIAYVYHETDTWLELTTLLIPGKNDSDEEIRAMCRWVVDNLGPDVPMHFTAFHPDWKMLDVPHTPAESLSRARISALESGVRYAYTGNVRDSHGNSTYCHHCGGLLIERSGYELGQWQLSADGACPDCGTALAGVFDASPGDWGSKRRPVKFAVQS